MNYLIELDILAQLLGQFLNIRIIGLESFRLVDITQSKHKLMFP